MTDSSDSLNLRKLIILIVEDDPDARELLQTVLEQRGAKVLAADSVVSAFELIEAEIPSIIISDIAMPNEDGIAFVRRLRTLPVERGGRTPAIAVSAYAANSDRQRALSAGFDRYLFKPVDFDDLIAAVTDLLKSEANGDSNQATG